MKSSMKHAATKQAIDLAEELPQLLIIGYGNSLRADDGAGIVMAQKMARHFDAAGLPTQLITETQLLPEMAADISAPSINTVVFVDTSVQSRTAQVEIRKIDVDTQTASTGHQLYPAALLLYASLLYGRNPHAWLVTIPGVDFAHGESFSPTVNDAVNGYKTIAHALYQKIENTRSRSHAHA